LRHGLKCALPTFNHVPDSAAETEGTGKGATSSRTAPRPTKLRLQPLRPTDASQKKHVRTAALDCPVFSRPGWSGRRLHVARTPRPLPLTLISPFLGRRYGVDVVALACSVPTTLAPFAFPGPQAYKGRVRTGVPRLSRGTLFAFTTTISRYNFPKGNSVSHDFRDLQRLGSLTDRIRLGWF